MNKQSFLDPTLFIWDEEKFEQDKYYYYDLSEVAVEAIDFILDNNAQIYISEDARDLLIEAFPCAALSEKLPEMYEFVNRILSFLVNSFPIQSDAFLDVILDADNVLFEPDPLQHSNILQIYKGNLLTMFLTGIQGGIRVMITSTLIWPDQFKINVFKEEQVLHSEIAMLKEKEAWQSYFLKNRKYVPSPKHIPGYGWGTENPYEDILMQALLEIAVGVDEKELVLYHVYNGIFLEFRYDNAGGYHAYPIPSQEVPSEIMQVFYRQDLITQKQLKRKM